MSVINQMLRDLDTRHATEQERAGLPPRLRTLPPTKAGRPSSWRMLLLAIALGALAIGVALGFFLSPDLPRQPVAVPAAPVAASPPAGSPAPAAVPAVPPVSVPKTEVPPDLGEMKHSTLLLLGQTAGGAPPEKTGPAIEKPAVAPPRPATKPAAPPPVVAPETAQRTGKSERAEKEGAVEMPPAQQAAEAQIDKRNSGGQARDMAEAEYRKGIQAVKRGEGAAALPQLQRALELDPLHAKARQTLLSVLVGSKQWAEAQRIAQSGLALEPAQTGWATILARLQFEQGNMPAALETLTRYAAHAGGDADYQGLFAYLLQKEQRYAEAAQHFQTALSLRPQEGRWWFGLGMALENSGRGSEARDAYLKAREAGNLPPDMATSIEQKLK